MSLSSFSRTLAALVLLGTMVVTLNAPARAQDACPSPGEYAAVESQFLAILNAARAQEGAGPLSLHPLLTQAATAHSVDMATQQYFDHTGKDGSSPGQRTARIGYTDGTIAENIAVNSAPNAQAVFDQWRNSPGHRRNMMNPDYNLMGLGMGCGTFNGFPNYTYYTQVLGRNGAATGGDTGGNTGGDAGGNTGGDTGGDTGGGDAGGDTGGDAGSDAGGDAGSDAGGDAGGDAGSDGGDGAEETGNTGNAFASKKRGGDDGGPVMTATGDPISFGNVLELTLPAGWLYAERSADSEVDIANADVSIYGYVGYYGASDSGVMPDSDLVALITEWAEGAGTVISPATAFTTAAGLQGASAVIEYDGEHVYLFLVFNPAQDWIAYGELYGEPSALENNAEVGAITDSLGLTEG